MKKIIVASGILAVLCAAFFPSAAKAADVSVGGYVWYAEWKPFFNKGFSQYNMSYSSDPGFLYGPLVSVRFADQWSWSNMFLYGKFDGDVKWGQSGYGGSFSMDPSRFDLDSTLNYTINRYFKVFGGVKGWYMKTSFTSPDGKMESSNTALGSGLGASVSLPLSNSLFAIANLSGLYLRNRQLLDSDPDDWYNVYGVNTTLSLAYYFAEAHTTASLGVRYQYLKYYADTSSNIYDDSRDLFYGVMLSVIYTF